MTYKATAEAQATTRGGRQKSPIMNERCAGCLDEGKQLIMAWQGFKTADFTLSVKFDRA